MAKEEIEQPGLDAQARLQELIDAEPEVVSYGGRKLRIDWLHKETENRFRRIMFKHRKDADMEEAIVKCYAAVRMDRRSGFLTWFLGVFYWWFYWRWVWYVKRERGTKFQIKVVEAFKKKVEEHSEACALTIILMIGATNLMMTRAAHEVGPVEQGGAAITP